MNCKWPTVEIFKKHFYEKYLNSEIEILEFLNNKNIKIKNKYGICISSKQTLLLYGNFGIRTSIDKTEYFINQAKEIHGNKYNYEKVKWQGSHNKIIITCNLHGDFHQEPTTHLDKSGCPICGHKAKTLSRIKPESLYIKQLFKVHADKYTIKENSYISDSVKIPHFCKKQKEWFMIKPSHLLQKHGCRKCANDLLSKRISENPTGWSYTIWQKSGEKSKNFDSFKVYILKCKNENEEFYKIGKTYNKVKTRFEYKRALPYKWEVLKIFEGTAREMSELEVNLKNLNKKHKYLPKITFSGKYECFIKLENYEEFFIE